MGIDLSTPDAVQVALHKAVDGMRETLEFCMNQYGGSFLPLVRTIVTDHNGDRVALVVGIESADDDDDTQEATDGR